MPPISNQIKLDFENLTKAGLKNLLKVFENISSLPLGALPPNSMLNEFFK